MNYANGDLYTGMWIGGERSGVQGTYEYVNGDIYIGEWRHDKKNGIGKLEMVSGDRYEGFN